MAQSVEHHLGKVEAPGSNPGNSSINKNTVIGRYFFIRLCKAKWLQIVSFIKKLLLAYAVKPFKELQQPVRNVGFFLFAFAAES